jgi:hypothetical protein
VNVGRLIQQKILKFLKDPLMQVSSAFGLHEKEVQVKGFKFWWRRKQKLARQKSGVKKRMSL